MPSVDEAGRGASALAKPPGLGHRSYSAMRKDEIIIFVCIFLGNFDGHLAASN